MWKHEDITKDSICNFIFNNSPHTKCLCQINHETDNHIFTFYNYIANNINWNTEYMKVLR